MDAADLAPSRLERARFKIQDILNKSREGRIGLVVFAGEPHIVTPLTDDGETIANLLSALSTEIVPAAGDAGAPALQLAADLLDQAGVSRGDLLLLSDGLADPAAALSMTRELRERGHRLSVLGVGTLQGAPVPQADGGFAEMARLPVETLQELARSGGGRFSLLSADDRDLSRVLLEPHRSADVQELADSGVERWIEHGAWLLPLILLLAASGFRRGWLAGLLAVMILPPPAQAFEWRDLWLRQDQQAVQALQQGQAEAAADQFTDPAWRGTALYQAGDYPAAAQAFAESNGVDADYNRGNALARSGQLAEAADAYRRVLEQTPGHADAQANLQLVEELMKQQEQQQSNQQPSEGDASKQQDPQQSQSGAGTDQQQQQGQDGQQQPEQEEAGESAEEEKDNQQGQPQAEQAENQADADQGQDREPTQSSPSMNDSQSAPEPEKPAEEDSMEAARRDVAEQAQTEEAGQPASSDTQDARSAAAGEQPIEQQQPLDESEMALQQWLRQIPEDPAGLLRRKFMVEHLRRRQQAE